MDVEAGEAPDTAPDHESESQTALGIPCDVVPDEVPDDNGHDSRVSEPRSSTSWNGEVGELQRQ